jgi:hypothetical protein
MLPPFVNGVLPPGDYSLSIDELRASHLVLGPGDPSDFPDWDARWRDHLVNQLELLVKQLWEVGINEIFVNGSFVEDKDHPNDIDGYFDCDFSRFISGDLERELNLRDPHKIWTWDPHSRRPYRGYPKRQLPMWHQYRVELYPNWGQPSGITDAIGHMLGFAAAFRRRRSDSLEKGIVKIISG